MMANYRTAIAVLMLLVCSDLASAVDFQAAELHVSAQIADPCQVITPTDVEAELGIAMIGKADLVRALSPGQPSRIMQASCVYRPTPYGYAQLTLIITLNNNPRKYLEARRNRAEQLPRRPGTAENRDQFISLPDIGDGAYAYIPPEEGPANIEVAVKAWVVTITLSTSGKGSTLDTLKHLATIAVKRLTLDAARSTDPGLDALAGTWFTTSADGKSPELEAVIVIGRDGSFTTSVARELVGRLQMTGGRWQVVDLVTDRETASGEYSLTGSGQLQISGTVQAEFTRVPCKQEPRRVRPFYRLTRYSLLRTELPGVIRLRLRRDSQRQRGKIDADLYGLWEGRGTINGEAVELLWRIRIDAPPQSVMTVLVTTPGRIRAANGELTITWDNKGPEHATYDLLGGRTEGAIAVRDSTREWQWTPYDPAVRNPRIERPIVGECPGQP